jgi:hypothetical protein
MKTISLRIPDSLHQYIKDLASGDQVSINQWINVAAIEKASARQTEAYLEKRAQKGSRDHMKSFLNSVPDVEPDEMDKKA